jgi:DNA mismatch endonuclease (patch repair protein)
VADSLSPERRSWNMSRIRGRNTKPELLVRSALHRMGYRFTISSTRNRKLPGRPDIVLPRYRTVVLVHGCYWHRHEGCRDATTPKSRTDWWLAKFAGNVSRDKKSHEALRAAGWHVVVVWECEVGDPARLRVLLDRALSQPVAPHTRNRAETLPAANKSGSQRAKPADSALKSRRIARIR